MSPWTNRLFIYGDRSWIYEKPCRRSLAVSATYTLPVEGLTATPSGLKLAVAGVSGSKLSEERTVLPSNTLMWFLAQLYSNLNVVVL